jgi:nicotinamidase-related amidase
MHNFDWLIDFALNVLRRLSLMRRMQHEVAVIIIDMQTGFVERLYPGEEQRIVANQLEIIRLCNEREIPIIVVEFDRYEFGLTISMLRERAEKNQHYKIQHKSRNSAFERTLLNLRLRIMGVKKLFLMGVNAEACVRKTAADAMQHGFTIITSNEVISGHDKPNSEHSIAWYKRRGIVLENLAGISDILVQS